MQPIVHMCFYLPAVFACTVQHIPLSHSPPRAVDCGIVGSRDEMPSAKHEHFKLVLAFNSLHVRLRLEASCVDGLHCYLSCLVRERGRTSRKGREVSSVLYGVAMVKCLVTGGCGFLGHWVVKRLRERGHAVRVLDVRTRDEEYAKHEVHCDIEDHEMIDMLAPVEYECGSICDRAACERALEGIQSVVHCASFIDWRPGTEDKLQMVNVEVRCFKKRCCGAWKKAGRMPFARSIQCPLRLGERTLCVLRVGCAAVCATVYVILLWSLTCCYEGHSRIIGSRARGWRPVFRLCELHRCCFQRERYSFG